MRDLPALGAVSWGYYGIAIAINIAITITVSIARKGEDPMPCAT